MTLKIGDQVRSRWGLVGEVVGVFDDKGMTVYVVRFVGIERYQYSTFTGPEVNAGAVEKEVGSE